MTDLARACFSVKQMEVQVLTYLELLRSKDLWDDALNRSLDNNIFLTWEWLSTWWKHYGKGKKWLMVALLRNGKIVAAAPLMHSEYTVARGFKLSKIEFLASPDSDYHTFLLTEKNDEHLRIIIEYAKQVAPSWDLIELKDIPEDSETARSLIALKESLHLNSRINDQTARIDLPNRFEDYLGRLSFSFRKNLTRYDRKLKRDFKVSFKVIKDTTANGTMKTFFSLHQKYWQTKKELGVFREQIARDFHSDIAVCFNNRGWLTLSAIFLNDEVRAVKYAFTYRNKAYCYLSGIDPELSKYNMGNLLNVYTIQYCISAGTKEYDLMRGDHPYKSNWQTRSMNNIEFWASKPRVIPILYNAFTKQESLLRISHILSKLRALTKNKLLFS
jgi:CelD/BcsL family acetyltransferase involved in cellulose biosynthesis